MIASHSGVAPFKTRGGISFGPLKVNRKERLFPAVPELLNKSRLSGPDPRLKRDQGSAGEGRMCFAVR